MPPTNPKITAYIQITVLALIMALFFAWLYLRVDRQSAEDEAFEFTATSTVRAISFPNVDIDAKSAYVYDAAIGKPLFAKDASEPLPLASLTKLMSALVASRNLSGFLQIQISPDDIRQDGDTGLYTGESWRASDLLDFTLIESSNDGIHAIASATGREISSTSTDPIATFVERMNETAKSLDLRDMRFYNESGLDVSPVLSGGYGSARDVVMLVDHLLRHYPHLLEATSLQTETFMSDVATHIAKNTDLAIPGIPNILASKTGYTDLAGGNLVVAFNAGLNHPIIISVLGSTYEGRFADLQALADATLVYLREKAASSTPPFK